MGTKFVTFGVTGVVDAAPAKGDKVARALVVQANFANGMITRLTETGPSWSLRKWKCFPRVVMTT
jgi:hypothetical protein